MKTETPQQVLAIFDFDGTITYQDSLFEFLIFAVGKKKFFNKFLKLTPTLFSFKFGFVPGDYAKEKVITSFFAGWNWDHFDKICSDFSQQRISSLVKDSAMSKIKWHQEQGHKVVVLSASLEHYLKYWCQMHNIECIGTVLEVENNRLTGKYKGINCYGPGKVTKLKERLQIDDFNTIYGYGNGKGDKEFLELSDHSFFRNFK